MMPELDGVEVCRRIRANHATRDTSIIILTARADEQTKIDALRAGASDFLLKPFSSAELGLRLQNQIMMGRFRREMSDLNKNLSIALEKIKENEVMMLRNEKLSALGRMSAGIIHEINNPLNYANAGLHAIATFNAYIPENERDEYEDTIKDIREGIDRVAQIVVDLRQFTHDEKSESPKDTVALQGITERAIRMLNHQLGDTISISQKFSDAPEILANSNQLVQVIINLIQNSVDAIQDRRTREPERIGSIHVSIEEDGDGVSLTIRDNGCGIPQENIQKIFDPFFTSKDVGQGMGLGLSITHQILKAHQAIVHVDSVLNDFTEIRLHFPSAISSRLNLLDAEETNEQYTLNHSLT